MPMLATEEDCNMLGATAAWIGAPLTADCRVLLGRVTPFDSTEGEVGGALTSCRRFLRWTGVVRHLLKGEER